MQLTPKFFEYLNKYAMHMNTISQEKSSILKQTQIIF